jgi:hypothetical protein
VCVCVCVCVGGVVLMSRRGELYHARQEDCNIGNVLGAEAAAAKFNYDSDRVVCGPGFVA